jgi:hypothetical protein
MLDITRKALNCTGVPTDIGKKKAEPLVTPMFPHVWDAVLMGNMLAYIVASEGCTLIVEPLVEMLMPFVPTMLEVAGAFRLRV